MNRNVSRKLGSIAGIVLLIVPVVGFTEVVYLDKEISVGDKLYTRSSSDDCAKVKIWRKTVTEINEQGINYTTALAVMTEADLESTQVTFENIKTQEGRSNICKQGGCYTKEEEPVSDAKSWLSSKCAFRNKNS